ncbi:MAG TPA: DUF362 domain-containing protein [Desulfatiglandales bacterium]|nr:DUF362 domain-containing protein [Desulfatiglandales bacterium]
MSQGVTLAKGSFSKDFAERLTDYYRFADPDGRYAERKLRQWEADGRVVLYEAKGESRPVGWVVYRLDSSAIEEIIVRKDEAAGEGLEEAIVDALIDRESLVSAEILEEDVEKYRWMLEYGFRPTRYFNKDGLALVKMDLSIAVYLRKIKGKPPAKTYPNVEKVVVEKVPPTRSGEELKASLMNVFHSLGGMEKFVKKGQNVVIKANVVADHGLRDGVYQGGVVTDVRLVRALIEVLLPVAGKVTVAEGASINRAETDKLFAHYGYDRLTEIDPKRVALVDLNTDSLIRKTVPNGKRMLSREIPLTLEQADVVINLPVMKTHFAALVSLSIKNLQGAIPPLEKYMSHFFGLWQNLVNTHYLVKPKLVIVDGLTAQENFGPVYGTPKTMNLIIGGTNPVAVDAVTMRIMGLDPALSPPVQLAHMQGLGSIEPEKINVAGTPIEEVMSPFKEAEINLESGKNLIVHAESACPGCKGYLHYVLNKLRRPDPQNPANLLIDRPFEKKVNVFLGPFSKAEPNPEETNVFLGICQQHHAEMGKHLPGCPPHAEVIMKGMFSLYPDVERPQYADQSAEDKLEKMLMEVLKED